MQAVAEITKNLKQQATKSQKQNNDALKNNEDLRMSLMSELDKKRFEKAMDMVWEELSGRYRSLFERYLSADWRDEKIWIREIAKQPVIKITGALKRLEKEGMPRNNGWVDLSVDAFLSLCPSDAELLEIPSFEQLWHEVQQSARGSKSKYSRWINVNAEKHGVDFIKLRNADKSAEKQMRKMYQALIDHLKNGGVIEEEKDKKQIEQIAMSKAQLQALLAGIGV